MDSLSKTSTAFLVAFQPLDHFLSKNTFFDLTTVSGAMCVFLDFGNEEQKRLSCP